MPIQDIINYHTDYDWTYGGIVLLGTSTTGPTHTMIRAYSIQDVIHEFGDGELLVAAHEALLANSNIRIYLMRLGPPSLSEASRYLALEDAYKQITSGSFLINTIVPVGVYLDSELPFYAQLADACADMTEHGYGTLGTIAVSSMNNTVLQDFNYIQNGRFISPIAARIGLPVGQLNPDDIVMAGYNFYESNAAVLYGILLASTKIEDRIVHHPIAGKNIGQIFSSEQYKNLAKTGITTLRETIRKGLVVNMGATMDEYENFRYIDYSRIAVYIQNVIRHITQDYIGNPTFQAIEATSQIQAMLNGLVDKSVIADFDLNIDVEYHDMQIDLAVVPIGGVHALQVNLRVTLKQGG